MSNPQTENLEHPNPFISEEGKQRPREGEWAQAPGSRLLAQSSPTTPTCTPSRYHVSLVGAPLVYWDLPASTPVASQLF